MAQLGKNQDSREIIQKLAEECQEFQDNFESRTGSEIFNSREVDSNTETETEDSPRDEDQFCKQMKLKDLSQDNEKTQPYDLKTSIFYANAASN